MSKKLLVALLCLGFIVVIYFSASRPASPAASFEERICVRVSSQFGDCKKIAFIDKKSNLVFAESSSGIIPILTNKRFTEIEKFIYPMLDFEEFKEEKQERGPLSWQAKNNVQKDFSMIIGFANEDVKTIIIHSGGDIQPKKFFVRDNLWVWYVTFHKDKVKLPVKVTAYDTNGHIIFGEKTE
ncbi:hypothetical protein JOC77_000205 [Peribacillus deserti]|uniref:DUF4309 domain-containing protein n=1 Tax=Peribacillus deserti TaxID=673318 RepID=A0ABS2QCA9_9BACI|nr:hypothetical protein [Peribacillus deserti]MBM7690802.1 hypothetical protein [Peribacillus deserti]